MSTMMGGFMILCVLLGILGIALVLYALFDLSRQPIDAPLKIVWALVILLIPVLGALASLIVNRSTARTA